MKNPSLVKKNLHWLILSADLFYSVLLNFELQIIDFGFMKRGNERRRNKMKPEF